MRISCTNTGKRFNRDWIFRHFNYEFVEGTHYAITGPNGSGKSTLLQVIACAVVSSEGKVSYTPSLREGEAGGSELDSDEVFKSIAITAPYLDVIEEMTLTEFLNFHRIFKPFLSGLSVSEIISIIGLQRSAGKQIRYYSSGMKQRVKLAQAVFSDTPCLLFDEPCTNLDIAGMELYHQLIKKFCSNRLVIVSSNDRQEYSFCNEIINMTELK